MMLRQHSFSLLKLGAIELPMLREKINNILNRNDPEKQDMPCFFRRQPEIKLTLFLYTFMKITYMSYI